MRRAPNADRRPLPELTPSPRAVQGQERYPQTKSPQTSRMSIFESNANLLKGTTTTKAPTPGHVNRSKHGNKDQDESHHADKAKPKTEIFTRDELSRLGKRFKKLDLDSDGALTMEEFLSIPEIKANPISRRVIQCFDTDKNGVIDFKEFVHGMSQFTIKNHPKERLKFAFKIYDMDNDGYISNGELFQVMKMMVGNNLTDIQLQQLVDHAINLGDQNGDNKLSFREFCDLVNGSSSNVFHKTMVVHGI